MENIQKIEFRKIRDFGEIISSTLEFLRQNVKKFFLSLLFICGPFIILSGIFNAIFHANFFPFEISADNILLSFFLVYFTSFVTVVLIEVVTYSYIDLYLDKNPDEFDINDVWQKTKHYFFPFVFLNIMVGLAVLLSILLLIIPGIYIAITLTLIFMVKIREDLSFFEAVNRCRYLIKDKWWFTFCLLLIFYVIQTFLSFILSVPEFIRTFITFFHMAEQGFEATQQPTFFSILTSIISNFGNLFYSIPLVGIAFHYYSLIESKEAKGLLNRLESIRGSETI